MTVVVIGAGGYTGFRLVQKICKEKDLIVIQSDKYTEREPGKFYSENRIKTLPNIESLLSVELSESSKIFYLGGHASNDHNFADIEFLTKAYILGTVQSLEIARKFHCTITIGGSYWELAKSKKNTNINLYASFQSAQNKILEHFASQYDVDIRKLYLADSYGINDWRPKLLQIVIRALKSGQVINLGAPEQIIGPIYIDDVIEDLIDISNLDSSNTRSVKYLQLVPDKIYTLQEFVKIIESILGRNIPVKWNTVIKEREDIQSFPLTKNIYERKGKYMTFKEGLSYILNQNGIN